MAYYRKANSTNGFTLFNSKEDGYSSCSKLEKIVAKALRSPLSANDYQEILEILNSRITHPDKLRNTANSWVFDQETDSFKIKIPDSENFPPPPYGVKGGAARNVLLFLLGSPTLPNRDIDIIRLGKYSLASDDDIARTYMPTDYQHGGRVELISEVPKYLHSRDLTCNEVFIHNQILVCSPFSVMDIITKTLRPSRYRSGTLSKPPQLQGRTFLKMLRIRAEMYSLSLYWRIIGIPENITFTESELAVELEKSLQRGPSIAELFLEYLVKAELLQPYDGPLLPHILEELTHHTIGEAALVRSHKRWNI